MRRREVEKIYPSENEFLTMVANEERDRERDERERELKRNNNNIILDAYYILLLYGGTLG